MTKKLYRSRADRKISGVCAGLAEYFDVDPTIVRALFVLLALAGGPGVILYIILVMIMPEQPY
ncbi:MAG: PspC domain-containing protein [Anaerolineae bacterium]